MSVFMLIVDNGVRREIMDMIDIFLMLKLL